MVGEELSRGNREGRPCAGPEPAASVAGAV